MQAVIVLVSFDISFSRPNLRAQKIVSETKLVKSKMFLWEIVFMPLYWDRIDKYGG
jgi:hypothetical protein